MKHNIIYRFAFVAILLFAGITAMAQNNNNNSTTKKEPAMKTYLIERDIPGASQLTANDLLKEYRLSKAIERLRKGAQNITEITFDCGFNSPSYFTKCFKKKFGLLPLTYQELV